MRRGKSLHRRLAVPVLGVVIGCAAGVASVTLGPAAAQQTGPEQRAVFDATHLPPLLTMPDERAELAYDVHCAAGDDEGAEAGCDVRGAVFVRTAGRGSFERLALSPQKSDGGGRQLAARVPDSLSSQPGGFEYYAELEAPDLGERVTIPAGGADAPHASRPLENPVDIALGRHVVRRRPSRWRAARAGRVGRRSCAGRTGAGTTAWRDRPVGVRCRRGRDGIRPGSGTSSTPALAQGRAGADPRTALDRRDDRRPRRRERRIDIRSRIDCRARTQRTRQAVRRCRS